MVTATMKLKITCSLEEKLYIAVYLVVTALVIISFLDYGNTFRRQNHSSLNGIILLILMGVLLQEVAGTDVKTAYLALSIGAALLFIHYSEFSQLKTDEFISWQHEQMMTDILTGEGSRFAYIEALKEYHEAGELPDDLAVFTIDINGLKEVNDSQGHEAGDQLICAAAECIDQAVGDKGKCYRTGGDEFVILSRMEKEEADHVLRDLTRLARQWRGTLVSYLSFSAGYALAADYPGHSVEQLVGESDLAMYEKKSIYYREARRNKRGRKARA